MENKNNTDGNSEINMAETKIGIFDTETNEESESTLEEAKEWNWGDFTVVRTVNGNQLSSWSELSNLVKSQQKNGVDKTVVFVSPSSWLLAGG